jgi:mono/diheme cytochrome c family protein
MDSPGPNEPCQPWARRRKAAVAVVLAAALPVAVLAITASATRSLPPTADQSRAGIIDYKITPVQGPSWISHLGLSFGETAMGRMGTIPPPSSADYQSRWNALAGSESLFGAFVLSGSDLYRLNCESCHQPDGRGSPPEVHSLLDPVRATSAALMSERLKARGAPVSDAMVRQMTTAAMATIRDRLRRGGVKMPAFDHLQGEEVDALVAYLKELAGVPGAGRRQVRLTESYERAGEHLVKGTCHICHGATGPGADPEALLRNVLPSLESIPRTKTIYQTIHKVRVGDRVEMGPLHLLSAGRMPVFYYLTDDEVAAAYLYLIVYPPRP